MSFGGTKMHSSLRKREKKGFTLEVKLSPLSQEFAEIWVRSMERIKRFQQSLLILAGEGEQEEDLLGESSGSFSLSPLQVLFPRFVDYGFLDWGLFFCSDFGLFVLVQRLYGFALCLVAGFAFMLLVMLESSCWLPCPFSFSLSNICFI